MKSIRVITFARIVTTRGEQFAFSPDHFDFTGLAEKKQMNAAANFRVFLGELARAAIGQSEPRRASPAREPLAHLRQLHRPLTISRPNCCG